MKFRRKPCFHEWERYKNSNVLQLDDMGYPLRLVMHRCKKCGVIEQHWTDIPLESVKELRTGKSVLCIWDGVN